MPFTSSYDLFTKIAKLGKKLVDLHLMKSDELNIPIAKFRGDEDNIIKEMSYNEEKERVRINNVQYFDGIKREVWGYYVGGYQVLYDWFKNRKGRKLSLEDIKHYCKIVTALEKTVKIQDEIDKLYPDVEKEIIPYKEQEKGLEKFTNPKHP